MELLKICRGIRGAEREIKYKVVRGAVNWAAWDFTNHPLGISVHCDDASFLRGEGEDEATLTLEMMQRLPDDVNEIQDDVLDDLVDDAAEIFDALEDAKIEEEDFADSEDMNPAVIKMDRTRDSATEVSDVSRHVQGIIATVFVEY